jgi:hypothetical protein
MIPLRTSALKSLELYKTIEPWVEFWRKVPACVHNSYLSERESAQVVNTTLQTLYRGHLGLFKAPGVDRLLETKNCLIMTEKNKFEGVGNEDVYTKSHNLNIFEMIENGMVRTSRKDSEYSMIVKSNVPIDISRYYELFVITPKHFSFKGVYRIENYMSRVGSDRRYIVNLNKV